MMGFNDRGFPEAALYDVRINRSLYEEIDLSDFLSLSLEYADKFFSDNLAFLLRFRNTLELLIETFMRINADKVQVVWSFRTEYL